MPREETMRDVAALVREALAGRDVHTIVEIEGGSDHRTFDVNGALVARLRRRPDEGTASAIMREVRLLEVVSRVSPVPVPDVAGANPDRGLIVVTRLPGVPLLDSPPRHPMALIDPLARFLRAVHGLPIAELEDLVERDEYGFEDYLEDAAEDLRQVAAHLPSDQQRAVEAFLGAPPPAASDNRTFCHNDLGAEHMLASDDGSVLTGVIDWSDAAIADPARDVGRILRDLGPAVARAIVRQLECAEPHHLLARARFYARCALLEDVSYGLRTAHHRYAERALDHFRGVFEDD
nr:Phosphotransferase enzyme family [uncultured bacterium]